LGFQPQDARASSECSEQPAKLGKLFGKKFDKNYRFENVAICDKLQIHKKGVTKWVFG